MTRRSRRRAVVIDSDDEDAIRNHETSSGEIATNDYQRNSGSTDFADQSPSIARPILQPSQEQPSDDVSTPPGSRLGASFLVAKHPPLTGKTMKKANLVDERNIGLAASGEKDLHTGHEQSLLEITTPDITSASNAKLNEFETTLRSRASAYTNLLSGKTKPDTHVPADLAELEKDVMGEMKNDIHAAWGLIDEISAQSGNMNIERLEQALEAYDKSENQKVLVKKRMMANTLKQKLDQGT